MVEGPEAIAKFYDEWAVDYDAAHSDWRATVVAHGTLLAEALAARGIVPRARVLDCTCGIGTQAIGLALQGYVVSASDLSAREIDRARAESATFGVELDLTVADLLHLDSTLPASWRGFDAVISANSLTHLGDDDTLFAAFTQMAGRCRPGGVVAVTNRDYEAVADRRPSSTPVQQTALDGIRRASFQLWDWAVDGHSYRMEDVLLSRSEEDPDGVWTVRSRATTLHAWRPADIDRAAFAAGLGDAEWTQHGHQPIATFIVP
ncbi:MAG: type 11 methyltransferase [Ilumatobacteraceae bacterium]|nr:type 11 methyltransferase [Ilumatobacteraceae bacterium]